MTPGATDANLGPSGSPGPRPRRALLGLIALHLAQGAWVIAADRCLPHQAVLDHYGRARALHAGWHEIGGADPIALAGAALRSADFRQPGLFVLAQPAFSLFGTAPDVASLVVLFAFVPLLLLATARAARALGGEQAGLLAAVLVGAYPIVLGHRVLFLPFLPMAALAAAAAAAAIPLARGEGRGWAFGVWVGLGLLVRADFALPAAGLAAGVLLQCPPDRRGVAARGLARALLGALLVAGAWFAERGVYAVRFYLGVGILGAVHPHDQVYLFSWANLAYYPERLLTMMAGGVLGSAAVGALACGWWERRAGARLLAAWVLVPWCFFLLIPLKSARYLIPVLPALAIATALVAVRFRVGLRIGLAGVALAQGLALVHLPALSERWTQGSGDPARWARDAELREHSLDYGRLAPWTEPVWEEGASALAAAIRAGSAGPAEVVMVDGSAEVYLEPLGEEPDIHLVPAGDLASRQREPDPERALRQGCEARLLVLVEPPSQEVSLAVEQLRAALESERARRELLARVRLPDGRHALLLGPRLR